MGTTVFSQIHAEAGRVFEKTTPATLTTAGNQTLTVAQLLGGLLLRDPNGGAVTDTTPTAAAIKAAIEADNKLNVGVGLSFEFTIRNTADAAETITVAGGTGVTVSGTATIAQSNSKRFKAVFTAWDTPAITLYSLGTVVH